MKNQFKKLKIASIMIAIAALTGCPESDDRKSSSHSQQQFIHVGPNWDALQKLDSNSSKFKIKPTIKKNFILGDDISFTLKSPKAGRLWVVFVDPNDEVNLLFPNPKQTDNTIAANKVITLPPKDGDWGVLAVEPTGQTIVSFIVTTGETDLNDVLSSSTKETMNEALSLIDASKQWSINTQIVTVKK